MILKLVKSGDIYERAANYSANKYMLSGQGLVTPDSLPKPNLTDSMYKSLWGYMSNQLINAIRHLKIPTNEKFVLFMLADHSKDDGICWPSVNCLMKECSLSRREVQKCLKYLQDNQLIKKNYRKGHSTKYQLNIPASNGRPNAPIVHDQGRPMVAQNLNLNHNEKEKIRLWKIKMGMAV